MIGDRIGRFVCVVVDFCRNEEIHQNELDKTIRVEVYRLLGMKLSVFCYICNFNLQKYIIISEIF